MSTLQIVDRFAPAAAYDEPDLERIAAHYTVEAYVLQLVAFHDRFNQPPTPAGSPERRLHQMEMRAACNTWIAACALNALLWPDSHNTAELIQAAHDGEGDVIADWLDEWMDRHGIDREAVIQAVEAHRAA